MIIMPKCGVACCVHSRRKVLSYANKTSNCSKTELTVPYTYKLVFEKPPVGGAYTASAVGAIRDAAASLSKIFLGKIS